MDQQLIDALEKWRLIAGRNGKPLGYKAWGEQIGIMYTSLFRFSKGEKTLSIKALRILAQIAITNNDNEMIRALAAYALNVNILSIVAAETMDNQAND